MKNSINIYKFVTVKNLFLLVVSFVLATLSTSAYGQNYHILGNVNGDKNINIHNTELEELSTLLKETIDLGTDGIVDDFKVFDFGHYVHHEHFEEGISGIIETQKQKASQITGNYLLFTRNLTITGENSLVAHLNLDLDSYQCLDENDLNTDLSILLSNYEYGSVSLFELEKELIQTLSDVMEEGFCCSGYYSSNADKGNTGVRSACLDQDKIAAIENCIVQNYSVIKEDFDLLLKIEDFIWGCNSENPDFKPLEKDGFVPYCYWKDHPGLEENERYGHTDKPFAAGIWDGIAKTCVDVAKVMKGISDLIPSYTTYFLECEEMQLTICYDVQNYEPPNILEINVVYENLSDPSKWTNTEHYEHFEESITVALPADNYFGRRMSETEEIASDDPNSTFLSCQKMFELRETIKAVYENFELQQFIDIIDAQIDVILDRTDSIDNESRYYTGFYGSQTVIGVVGAVKSFAQLTKKAGELGSLSLNAARKLMCNRLMVILKSSIDPKLYLKFYDNFQTNYKALYAFYSGKINVKAWEKVTAGGIDDFIHHPGYLRTLEKVTKYQDEALAGATGNVKYYRVQTEHPLSKALSVESDNLIFHKPNKALNISTTSRTHADYYAAKKIEQGHTVEMIEFEIPKSIDIQMKRNAVPQHRSKENLLNPNGKASKIVDPMTPGDPFELSPHWHQIIKNSYIKGSAKIVN